ncbi:hypothetical protein FBU31_002367 [Coemansia sp. 'formosensis']|nr:hypothetical protein FBU31_002367 [Coemansia sp. 'formosensis']
MTNTNSEKRGYLEQTLDRSSPPTSNSQPPPQHPDYFGNISQEDMQASSSSRVPPAYTDMERGFNNGGGGPVASMYPPNTYSPNTYPPASYQPPPMNSPPYSAPYQPPPQQPPQQYQSQQYQSQQPSSPLDEPICLTLLNPRMISSGFTMVMPDGLHRLAPRPIDSTKWTMFMQELNDTLRKAPGTITHEVSGFWLVHIATLGIAGHARNMYQSRVEGKAAAIVEKYNRAEFASWGIRVHFEVVQIVDAADGIGPSVIVVNQAGRRRREERRQRREDRRGNATQGSTLELVIERA